jgi:hypothetical protein
MKTFILFWLVCFQSCGPQTSGGKKYMVDEGPEIFNSKYVRPVKDTSSMMLIENVVVKYGDFYVEADSALWEKPQQTVTAYGIKKARFKGNEMAGYDFKTILRYTKGKSPIRSN